MATTSWPSTAMTGRLGTSPAGTTWAPFTGAGAERLEALVGVGANHLLLNPVCRYADRLEALATVVGLS